MHHRNNLVYVFCTRCVVRCFHHDTDHRLGAALSYEDASVIAQGLCYVFYCFCTAGLAFAAALFATRTFFKSCG
mgnify:CR=1 FL=1